VTTDLLDGQVKPIFEASEHYRSAGVPLVVLAGKDYGMGSSRDWAAKGTFLLGVRAVIAESFERIHRSNLVMMGVLPLEYPAGTTAESLGLTGHEVFEVAVDDSLQPRDWVTLRAVGDAVIEFEALARVDTPVEVDYLRHGGILHYVLREMARR
jgi:aconitate hydratase